MTSRRAWITKENEWTKGCVRTLGSCYLLSCLVGLRIWCSVFIYMKVKRLFQQELSRYVAGIVYRPMNKGFLNNETF